MKPVSFSRTKGCKCRAWGFDKTAKDVQQWSLTPAEEGDVCLSVSLALFPLTIGNKKKNKTKQNKTKQKQKKNQGIRIGGQRIVNREPGREIREPRTEKSEQRTGKRK